MTGNEHSISLRHSTSFASIRLSCLGDAKIIAFLQTSFLEIICKLVHAELQGSKSYRNIQYRQYKASASF